MYEIEYRGVFDAQKFKDLKGYLDRRAESLGQDDKDCYFHIFPDKLLKLVKDTSKVNTKVSLKLNRIGEGSSFPETEFYFDIEEFGKRFPFLKTLPAKVMHEPQERINNRYKECEIALKYSNTRGTT
ncbi:MAG: hypothetical protein ACLFNN_02535 [Candidatus Paceibacterota bacterium]